MRDAADEDASDEESDADCDEVLSGMGQEDRSIGTKLVGVTPIEVDQAAWPAKRRARPTWPPERDMTTEVQDDEIIGLPMFCGAPLVFYNRFIEHTYKVSAVVLLPKRTHDTIDPAQFLPKPKKSHTTREDGTDTSEPESYTVHTDDSQSSSVSDE